jgi:tetratricopeptide (TPR) repeat protein
MERLTTIKAVGIVFGAVLCVVIASLRMRMPAFAAAPTARVQHLALEAYECGDYPLVLKLLEKSDEPADDIFVGKVFYECGVPSSFHFMRAFDRAPKNAEANAWRGWLYFKENRRSEALQLTRRAVALDPKSAEAHALLALCLNAAGKPEEAAPEILKAVELGPNMIVVEEIESNFYASQLDTAKAQSALDKMRAAHPKNPLALLRLAQHYQMRGELAPAFKMYDAAIVLGPKFQYGYFQRADFCMLQKLNAKAVSDCTKVIEMDAMDELVSKARRLRANCFLALKQYQSAADDFDVLVSHGANPTLSGNARKDVLGRAEAYGGLKNYKKAIESVNFLLRLQPSTEALLIRARFSAEATDYLSSLHDYNALVAADDDVPPEWLRARAKVLKKLGRIAEANADIEKANAIEKHL